MAEQQRGEEYLSLRERRAKVRRGLVEAAAAEAAPTERRAGYTVETGDWKMAASDQPLDEIYEVLDSLGPYDQTL